MYLERTGPFTGPRYQVCNLTGSGAICEGDSYFALKDQKAKNRVYIGPNTQKEYLLYNDDGTLVDNDTPEVCNMTNQYSKDIVKFGAFLATGKNNKMHVVDVGVDTFVCSGASGKMYIFDLITGKSLRSNDCAIMGIWSGQEGYKPNQEVTEKRAKCEHKEYINLSVSEKPWFVCESCGLDHPDNYKVAASSKNEDEQ